MFRFPFVLKNTPIYGQAWFNRNNESMSLRVLFAKQSPVQGNALIDDVSPFKWRLLRRRFTPPRNDTDNDATDASRFHRQVKTHYRAGIRTTRRLRMDDELKQLLRMLISVTARGAFPEDSVRKIVAPTKSSERYAIAYNLCDGTHTRAEIARLTGIDKDNLNKVVKRWIAAGVIFEIEQDGQANLLHLYPLTMDPAAKLKTKSTSDSFEEFDYAELNNPNDETI
jgi:hypothetical protein